MRAAKSLGISVDILADIAVSAKIKLKAMYCTADR